MRIRPTGMRSPCSLILKDARRFAAAAGVYPEPRTEAGRATILANRRLACSIRGGRLARRRTGRNRHLTAGRQPCLAA